MALQSICVAVRTQDESMLQALAQSLSAGIDALLGDAAKERTKRGPAPVLARHMERIGALPKPPQRFVIQVLESVPAQQGR